jgi:hypothetical protein
LKAALLFLDESGRLRAPLVRTLRAARLRRALRSAAGAAPPQAEIVRRFGVSRPVILLWDGLPAHRSRLTRRALAGHRFWLRREPLPAYTPELNPVE